MPDKSSRDQYQTVHIQGVSSVDDDTATNIHVDPITNRTLVDSVISSGGTPELYNYGYNKSIVASATVTYLCKEDIDGNYLIEKIDTTTGTEITYATITNNPTVTTYANAVAGYLTLTYGTYSEAF